MIRSSAPRLSYLPSWQADTRADAFEGMQGLVEDGIRDLEAIGESVPETQNETTRRSPTSVRFSALQLLLQRLFAACGAGAVPAA
jgi:hypothetical protein